MTILRPAWTQEILVSKDPYMCSVTLIWETLFIWMYDSFYKAPPSKKAALRGQASGK